MTCRTCSPTKTARVALLLFLPLIFPFSPRVSAGGLEPICAAGFSTAPDILSVRQAGIFAVEVPPVRTPLSVEDADAQSLDDKIYYVSPGQVDAGAIPAPPADGSTADREDMAAVRKWQAERTEAQCAAALAQEGSSYDEFFGAVSPFSRPTPADVEKFFGHVRTDAGSIDLILKQKFKRPRPFLRDAALDPCLGREKGYSYPSGHATVSRVFGDILSSLLPRSGAVFMSYADQAALNRVIGGVHHPTDIEEGKKLGDLIYQALLKNPDFNSDLEALRKYLKH